MRKVQRFFLFLKHMVFGGHKYRWSNTYEGSKRCVTCRHVSHRSTLSAFTED